MKKRFSPSAFLFDLGAGICFAPFAAFSSPYAEKEKKPSKLGEFLLPYRKRVKNAFAKTSEQSAVLCFFRLLIRRFFCLRIRSVGVFFFACGFLQILSYFAGSFIPGYTPDASNLLFGVVLILSTMLCSFTRGDVGDALKRSFLFWGILSPLLGVREWQIPGGKSRDNPLLTLLLGVAAGILSFIFSPVRIFFAVILFVLLLFLAFSPEAGMILCAALGLVIPRTLFFFLLFFTFASFLFKCCIGKRSLHVAFSDLAPLLFLLPFSGSEGWEGSIFLFLIYFLAVGLIKTLPVLSGLFSSLTSVSLILAAFLVLETVLKNFFPSLFFRLDGLEAFFFVRPDEATGCLFAMMLPLALASFRCEESGFRRLFSLLSFVLLLGALFPVKNSAVWLAALIGVTVFLLFSYRASLFLTVLAGLLLTAAFRIFPAEYGLKVLSLFGMESGSLKEVTTAHSGLLDLFSSGWFFPLVAFLVLALFFYQTFRFRFRSTAEGAYPPVLGALSSVLVFCVLTFQNVMPDYRSLIVLMTLFAIPSAATNISSRREVRLNY